MDDEDDEFLYGTSSAASATTVSQPQPVENSLLDSSGIISHFEAVVAASNDAANAETQAPLTFDSTPEPQLDAPREGDEEGDGEDESEDEDIEIIMEPTARSLDFRQQRSQQQRPQSNTTPARAPPPSLTTEYNLIQRLDSNSQPQPTSSQIPSSQPSVVSQPSAPPPSSSSKNLNITLDNGVDPSTLPVAKAPPSHPEIDPTAPGMLDGRAIFEVDIAAMTEKPWRRAGSDISDWFNYGFDELSWEAYCYRRREFGEMADNLKVNVLNFSAMPEDQLTALPTDIRQMVMTGATAAMMNGAPNPGMMAPGVMMDMGMMNQMGMGMNGDMMGQQMMPVDQRGIMMQDTVPAQGPMGNGGTPEQGGGGGVPVGMMQDGFAQNAPMGMGLPGDFSIQDQPQMFTGPGIDGQVPQNVTPVAGSRGPTPSYRARGMGVAMRARGFPQRGRGRGGMYGGEGAPAVARPASPLPPNVPTGPRNQNKYKDRDGNAPAVDGLDYGGDRAAARTPSGDSDERSSSRKRRGSPSMDDRTSKRR